MLLKNKVITSAALALTMGAVFHLAGCGDGVGAGGTAPTATLAFTSMSALQANTDVSATAFNVTATFSTEVDGFDASDITGPGTTTVSNFVAVSKKVFTFDVTMSTKSGTLTLKKDGAFSVAGGAGNAAATLKLVSFATDIAPILNERLTDGTQTNSAACVHCHSGGTQTERQARFPTVCYGSSSGNLASCGTTTFPKMSTDFTGGTAAWATAIPTVTAAGVRTKVDTVTYDPENANSKFYFKVSSAGNMPQNSTTAVPATENYRNNPVRPTATQIENVYNWIKQGAKDN